MAARRRVWSIWTIAALFGPFVLVTRTRRAITDNSFLWHVTAGRVQEQLQSVITADPFSFTAAGQAWRTQSWLAELGYAWAVDLWSIDVGKWIPFLVGGLTFLVLGALALKRLSPGLGFGIVMALSAMITLPFMNPRPVIFSYLFMALVVAAVEHRALRWTIPLTAWAWAGLHGSFFMTFVIIGLTFILTLDRALWKPFVASVVTVSLTAHGLGVWGILAEFLQGNEALSRIQEWQPPDLLSLPLWPILATLVLFVARTATRGLHWREGFVVLAWFGFGLTATRSIPLMWIGLFPVICDSVAVIDELVPTRATLPRPIVAGFGLVLVGSPFLVPSTPGLDPERFPIAASEYLHTDRVFHDDATGGYLIYSEWPERLVYIDDRAELYHDQYLAFSDALSIRSDWEEELDAWEIDEALLRIDQPLARVLRATGWTEVFSDEKFVVFERPS
jgi:hypothetical protein